MSIPDAAIEAAAEAMYYSDHDDGNWATASPALKTGYRRRACAAMPAIRDELAREVNRAKPNHITRDYTPVDQAWDQAANVVRGGTP